MRNNKKKSNGIKIKQSETLRFEQISSVKDMIERTSKDSKEYKDFGRLEKLVSACARETIDLLLISKSARGSDIVSLEVNDDVIEALVKCYSRSGFNRVGNRQYRDFIMNQTMDFVQDSLYHRCIDQDHFDLILPIMFYLVILNNEYNIDTVQRRNRKIQKNGIDSVSWQKKYNFKTMICNFSDMLYQINTSKHEHILSETRRFKEVLSQSRSGEKSVRKILTILKPLTTKVDMIEELAEIEFFSKTSNLGLFLLDILRSTHNSNRPMDTLIRLYIMVHIDKRFLMMLRYVSTDTKELINWDSCNEPLWYYFDNIEKESYIYPVHGFPLSCPQDQQVDESLFEEFVKSEKFDMANKYIEYVSFKEEKPRKPKKTENRCLSKTL